MIPRTQSVPGPYCIQSEDPVCYNFLTKTFNIGNLGFGNTRDHFEPVGAPHFFTLSRHLNFISLVIRHITLFRLQSTFGVFTRASFHLHDLSYCIAIYVLLLRNAKVPCFGVGGSKFCFGVGGSKFCFQVQRT